MAATLCLTVLGCQAFEPGVPLTGTWGGQDIELQLTTTGGTMKLGCGGGVLAAPLIPDNGGRVSALGETTPGMGAPPPPNYVPPHYQVRYTGRVDGKHLTLSVTRVDDASITTRYALVRGRSGTIYLCP